MIVSLTLPHFAAIVTGVGTCIVDALDQTPAGAPDRQCLLLPTGMIPWDNCDCGGQVALAIRRTYAADTFPTEAPWTAWRACGPKYQVAEVIVSVTRCVTGLDQAGQPPPCATALAEAIRLENDRTATRQAIACCLNAYRKAMPPTHRVTAWLLGPSVTVGELGGCAGVETTFLVGVGVCACPDDPDL
ncbi:MAG: hypothetical protein WAM94_08990 [Chromatiaceae bacterium]